MKNEASLLIDKIMNLLEIYTNKELADKLNLSAAAISRWKKYNYIDPIKKKCRELGIYNEIFGDADFNTIIIDQGKKSKAAGRDFNETPSDHKIENLEFENLTVEIIKKLIKKFGEEKLQKKLMDLMVEN